MKVDISYSVQRGLINGSIVFNPATAANTSEGRFIKAYFDKTVSDFNAAIEAQRNAIEFLKEAAATKAEEAVGVVEVPAAADYVHVVESAPVEKTEPVFTPAPEPTPEVPAEVKAETSEIEDLPKAPSIDEIVIEPSEPEAKAEEAAQPAQPAPKAKQRKGSATSL